MGYPQTRGTTEVTNRTILKGFKTRLDNLNGRRLKELQMFSGLIEQPHKQQQEKLLLLYFLE